jgi:inhibitor of KinA
MSAGYPRLRFVGDTGVLVEFGEQIDQSIHEQVLGLDRLIASDPFKGITFSIPSYAALLIGYDPCTVWPEEVAAHIRQCLDRSSNTSVEARTHKIPVCYHPSLAPDLEAVAARAGLGTAEVIDAHLSATYRVYMYGFAPGFAYLGGVPKTIQIPRRSEPVPRVPAGSLIIAGPQCIVTTLDTPSGWWSIGRSPAAILKPEAERPFLFNVGDKVRFFRIEPNEFETYAQIAS